MKLYLTGGTVRDRLLGLPERDLDFAVEAGSYEEMTGKLLARGVTFWQERPEFVTVRGHWDLPKGLFGFHPALDDSLCVDADFTLCRKETMYSDKRHPDTVTPADLATDLSRRDFTINAMAVAEDGTFVDPYGGTVDIEDKLVRCVGDPFERFEEDPLRIMRALRFAAVLGFDIEEFTARALDEPFIVHGLKSLPVERIQNEISKVGFHWYRFFKLVSGVYPLVGAHLQNETRLRVKAVTQ